MPVNGSWQDSQQVRTHDNATRESRMTRSASCVAHSRSLSVFAPHRVGVIIDKSASAVPVNKLRDDAVDTFLHCFIGSHLGSAARVTALGRLVESIRSQSDPLEVHVSWHAASSALRTSLLNGAVKASDSDGNTALALAARSGN